jgi:hypothetical protein
MPKQQRMFESEDLPLFSGTAPKGELQDFNPQPADRQLGMFDCPLCRDTGLVKVGSRWVNCLCERGQCHE